MLNDCEFPANLFSCLQCFVNYKIKLSDVTEYDSIRIVSFRDLQMGP